jgi:hypothetical protein
LERAVEKMRDEIQQMRIDEKRTKRKNEYSKLREQLSIKRKNLYTLIQQDERQLVRIEKIMKKTLNIEFYRNRSVYYRKAVFKKYSVMI